MTTDRPIGVFDSGAGGLSVLREIRAAMPHEDLFYVADTAHIPYGDKPATFIEARAIAITEFFRGRGAKAVVVACNTASGVALDALRARFLLPIVGMEPAVKPAAQRTRSGVIGVLATRQTLASNKFANLLTRFGKNVTVHVQPCAGFVEQVEAGKLADAETRDLVARYVRPLLQRGADVLVLGCTHYPFLRPLIEEVAGPDVAVLDPNAAVARELARRLELNKLSASAVRQGTEKFWSSAPSAHTKSVMALLWGTSVDVQLLPNSA